MARLISQGPMKIFVGNPPKLLGESMVWDIKVLPGNPMKDRSLWQRRTPRQAKAIRLISQFLNGHPMPRYCDKTSKSGRRRYKWDLMNYTTPSLTTEVDAHLLGVINDCLYENGYLANEMAYFVKWKDNKGNVYLDDTHLICCVNPE